MNIGSNWDAISLTRYGKKQQQPKTEERQEAIYLHRLSITGLCNGLPGGVLRPRTAVVEIESESTSISQSASQTFQSDDKKVTDEYQGQAGGELTCCMCERPRVPRSGSACARSAPTAGPRIGRGAGPSRGACRRRMRSMRAWCGLSISQRSG